MIRREIFMSASLKSIGKSKLIEKRIEGLQKSFLQIGHIPTYSPNY